MEFFFSNLVCLYHFIYVSTVNRHFVRFGLIWFGLDRSHFLSILLIMSKACNLPWYRHCYARTNGIPNLNICMFYSMFWNMSLSTPFHSNGRITIEWEPTIFRLFICCAVVDLINKIHFAWGFSQQNVYYNHPSTRIRAYGMLLICC